LRSCGVYSDGDKDESFCGFVFVFFFFFKREGAPPSAGGYFLFFHLFFFGFRCIKLICPFQSPVGAPALSSLLQVINSASFNQSQSTSFCFFLPPANFFSQGRCDYFTLLLHVTSSQRRSLSPPFVTLSSFWFLAVPGDLHIPRFENTFLGHPPLNCYGMEQLPLQREVQYDHPPVAGFTEVDDVASALRVRPNSLSFFPPLFSQYCPPSSVALFFFFFRDRVHLTIRNEPMRSICIV